MSIHVGIDLVSIAEVERAVQAHGERYLHRVYTARELAESRRAPHRLAARFAAKEAAMKALEVRGGIGWRSVAVVGEESARPMIELHGEAARLAELRNVQSIAVSLTHERDHAAAVVVMEAS
jgi:holo-[acyl-carrier protein] synthase